MRPKALIFIGCKTARSVNLVTILVYYSPVAARWAKQALLPGFCVICCIEWHNRDVDEKSTHVMDRLLDVTRGATGCAATGELGIMTIRQACAFIDLFAGNNQAEVMA